MAKQLTPIERDEIVAMLACGIPNGQIAKRFNCSPSAVTRIRKLSENSEQYNKLHEEYLSAHVERQTEKVQSFADASHDIEDLAMSVMQVWLQQTLMSGQPTQKDAQRYGQTTTNRSTP